MPLPATSGHLEAGKTNETDIGTVETWNAAMFTASTKPTLFVGDLD